MDLDFTDETSGVLAGPRTRGAFHGRLLNDFDPVGSRGMDGGLERRHSLLADELEQLLSSELEVEDLSPRPGAVVASGLLCCYVYALLLG